MSKEKLIPELRFPEFVEEGEWNIETLSNLANEISEKTNGRKFKLISITSGIGLVSQYEKFGREIAGNSYVNYLVIRNGDFAYNKSSTKLYSEGEIALYEDKEIGAVPNSIFTCFRFNKDKIYSRFAKYPFVNNLHGKWLRKYIAVGARANGALQVKSNDLFSIPFSFPKLPEQQKIASCLSSLDEVIAAHSQKLELLKDYKKGLMQNLFPQEGEKVPKLRFKEFENDGEWMEKSLSEVANYENGKAHEQDISEYGKFVVVNSKFISTDGEVAKYSNTAYCLAEKEDVLMVLSDVPNGRAIAKCFYVNEENKYTVNQRICKITSFCCDSIFLYYTLNRNPYFLAFDDGVKQTNLRNDDVQSFPFFVPVDPKEQQKIASCLSSLDALITAQKEKIEQLKLHKKGLMQGLFPKLTD